LIVSVLDSIKIRIQVSILKGTMSTPFNTIFTTVIILNLGVTFRSSSYWKKCERRIFGSATDTEEHEILVEEGNSDRGDMQRQDAKRQKLLYRYLAVYILSVLGDWLQGPYVYALYDAYGYSQHVISVLFVAGFGSSMIFGSFIGDLADKFGRKRYTIIYILSYIGSCVTKHFRDFYILLLGRVLGGISTSLLFSVFDSWLIRAHADLGLSSHLPSAFAAASYGNSIAAIVAGLIANKVASSKPMTPWIEGPDAIFHTGGYLNPFDVAIIALAVAGIFCTSTWEENYGSSNVKEEPIEESVEKTLIGSTMKSEDIESKQHNSDSKKGTHWTNGLKNALLATIRSTDILFAGLISSLFEGSMYIFVFMWTPAMTNLTKKELPAGSEVVLPFGLIFSTFMVCCMAGSSMFSILIERMKVEIIGCYIIVIATVAFAVMTLSDSSTVVFIAFNAFEICVGLYFPMMGTMKSCIVPEDKRTAIYNIYRVPLNFIVVSSLLTDLTPSRAFSYCTGMLAIASILQMSLASHRTTVGHQIVNTDDESMAAKVTDNNSLKLEMVSPLGTDKEC